MDSALKSTNEDNTEGKSDYKITQTDDDMEENVNDNSFKIEEDNTSDDDEYDDNIYADASGNTGTTVSRLAAPIKHTFVNDNDFEIEDDSTSDYGDSDENDIEVIYDGKTANASGDDNTARNRPNTTIKQKFVQFHPVGVLSKQQVRLCKHTKTDITDNFLVLHLQYCTSIQWCPIGTILKCPLTVTLYNKKVV